MVEHNLAKVRVAGSSPVSRSNKRGSQTSFFSMSHWVYIIYSESADVFYKGQTDDLTERIIRPNNRWEKATRHGVPWKLVWRIEKPDRSSAMNLEKKLKHLTRLRLIEFIRKYPEGVAGPDALTFIVRGQGADR